MDLQTLQTRQTKIAHDASQLLALADRETRALTTDEEKQYDAHLKSLEDVGKQIARFKGDASIMDTLEDLESGGTATNGGPLVVGRLARREKSLGEQFVESTVGEYLRKTNKGGRSGGWRSGDVELKAVLLEDNLLPPQVLPGIVPSPQRPIVMSELFAIGPTGANTILFMEETLYTNAAAPVAEGGIKPESTITFANKTSRVEKIAHWLPVSDEFLEDEPALRAYIDARLRLGVLLALDTQLLTGTGVSPQLLGLLVRTDLTPPLAAPAGTSGPDAIAAQIAAVEQASQLPVDGIVMNGTDWLTFALAKTTTGEYLGPNPFETPQTPTLWGRRVALTAGMPQGTALVGAFRSGGGQLFQRGGLRVEASNSHADFFIKNITAIRAEVRVALVLTRPQGFGKVTGLNPPA
jgi:HK97 family phage major capsid protein